MSSKFEKNNYISDDESDVDDTSETSDDAEDICITPLSLSPKPQASAAEISESSTCSIIDDSLQNISKLAHETSGKIVEESILEESSTYDSNTVYINVSSSSDSSDIQCLTSVTDDNSKDNIIYSSSISSNSTRDSKISVNVGNWSRSDVNVNDVEESPDKSKDSDTGLFVPNRSKEYSRGSRSDDDSSRTSIPKSDSGLSDRSLLERKIADRTTAYQNIMRALHGCDTSKLKDGGKLLHDKLIRYKEEIDDLKEQLRNVQDCESPVSLKERVDSNPLFYVKDYNNTDTKTPKGRAALTIDALEAIHESLTTCPDEHTFEDDPRGLEVRLMPHQKHALAWLLWREKQTPSGGILADDMGLGKTLSVISLILRSEEYRNNDDNDDVEEKVQIVDGVRTYKGKTLVVCPASLAGHWEEQVKKHCKSNTLNVTIHHGKTREYQAKRLAGYDVVITTYGLLAEENKCDINKRKGVLFRVRWDRIILDEAHVIRNHKTQKAVAACDLIGTHRWCLTGTPVHNKELDMYSLLKFIRCSPFDDRNVWKRWVDNKSASGVQRLKTVIKSILLRRTKEDLKKQGGLKELPSKKFVPIYVKLDEEELKVYHEVLIFSKSLLAEYLRQREFNANNGTENIEKIRSHLKGVEDIKTTEIFVLLLRLRQICCLPGLIHSFLERETCIESDIEPENPVVEDLYTQLSRMSLSGSKEERQARDDERVKNVLRKTNPVFKMDRPSTKIQTLLNVIEEILETDDKIVIVSQWTSLLKKLESHICRLKVGIVVFDGTIPLKLRSKIVDDFNRPGSNVRIMLLSLNAGGVGLNLLGGNRLIIFEPHWNPQLESQACDRVYRVGQRKQVYVYKIICRDTIEERIEQLQKRKLELADTILRQNWLQGASQGQHLTLMDLATLFDVGQKF